MSATSFADLINTFAAISDPACADGVQRLGFSALERQSHQVFVEFMENLGLSVWTDAVGNTIAQYPGAQPLSAIGVGSHLDSVYRAGQYDGIAGVVTAMLVAERLTQEAVTTRHPIRFVAFATEEGARFGQACIGSRLVTGRTSVQDLQRLKDSDGVSAYQAMKDCGLRPDDLAEALWNPADWDSFLELHIEQGPALHSQGIDIGVVNLISGSCRFLVTFTGIASHSGGTPMHLRKDAFMAAAEFALAAEAIALDSEHHGTRVTIGQVSVEPGSITTIPGKCTLSVDVRDIDSVRQRETARVLVDLASSSGERRGIGVETQYLSDVAPAFLSNKIQTALADAARSVGASHTYMYSGASHDAQIVSSICDTGMVFVPSLNGGVSHSPRELSRIDDLEMGTKVVYEAILRLDRK